MTQNALRRVEVLPTYHVGAHVWVPLRPAAEGLGAKRKATVWAKGTVKGVSKDASGTSVLELATEDGQRHCLAAAECPLQNERDDTVDDLVKSDFLHEPGCRPTNGLRTRVAHHDAGALQWAVGTS